MFYGKGGEFPEVVMFCYICLLFFNLSIMSKLRTADFESREDRSDAGMEFYAGKTLPHDIPRWQRDHGYRDKPTWLQLAFRHEDREDYKAIRGRLAEGGISRTDIAFGRHAAGTDVVRGQRVLGDVEELFVCKAAGDCAQAEEPDRLKLRAGDRLTLCNDRETQLIDRISAIMRAMALSFTTLDCPYVKDLPALDDPDSPPQNDLEIIQRALNNEPRILPHELVDAIYLGQQFELARLPIDFDEDGQLNSLGGSEPGELCVVVLEPLADDPEGQCRVVPVVARGKQFGGPLAIENVPKFDTRLVLGQSLLTPSEKLGDISLWGLRGDRWEEGVPAPGGIALGYGDDQTIHHGDIQKSRFYRVELKSPDA